MFKVTTVNLAPDTLSAIPGHGVTELGELSPEEFTAVLARFRDLDPVQNLEADPHILVTAHAGKFIIRTGQGKLHLYDARDTTVPYVELTPDDVVANLDRPAAPLRPDSDSGDLTKEGASTPSRGIALAILIAGLSLNGYTLYSVVYTKSVSEKPAVTLLTDATEITKRQSNAAGTYATGDQPGDRVIIVTSDGKVRFIEIGVRSGLAESTDTYRPGRHDSKPCLATGDSGVVDILNPDTLVYYRDTYRRTK
jgi:hypothetical protein